MLVQLTLNMGKLESREGDLGLHHCPRSGEVPKPQPGTSVLTRECHGDSSFPLNLSSGAHSWLMVAPAINSRELEKCALSCLPCPSCTWGDVLLEEKSSTWKRRAGPCCTFLSVGLLLSNLPASHRRERQLKGDLKGYV